MTQSSKSNPVMFKQTSTSRHLAPFVALAALALSLPGNAHVLFIDTNPGLPGIQTAEFVPSGTVVTVDVGILGDGVPAVDAPGAWDTATLDITWGGFGGPLATLTPTTPPLAGGLAGSAATIAELVQPGAPGILVGPGAPLTTLGLAPQAFPPILGGNLGGVGLVDTGVVVPFGGVGGPGALAPGVRLDVFSISFLATGAPGSTVLIDPIGVMTAGGTIPGPGLPGAGFAGIGALGGAGYTNNGGTGVTITIIPEPATTLLSLLGFAVLLRRRR